MSLSQSRRELLERELLSRPVGSLQYMLSRLAGRRQFLPQLAVDGVFGPRTLEAVLLYQREMGLPVTGSVDGRTWEAIRADWLDWEASGGRPRPLRAFPEGDFPSPVEGEGLILPQTMLSVLARRLEGIAPHRADGSQSAPWAENVRWLQKAAGLPQTGVLDRPAWEALSRLYELFVISAPAGPPGFSGGWG